MRESLFNEGRAGPKKKNERVRPRCDGSFRQLTRFRVLHCDLREVTAVAIKRESYRKEKKVKRE